MAGRVGLVRCRSQDDAGRDEEGGAGKEEEQVARVPGRRTDSPFQPERLPVTQDRQLALATFQGADRIGKGPGLLAVDEQEAVSWPEPDRLGCPRRENAKTALLRRQEDARLSRRGEFPRSGKADGNQNREKGPEQPPPEEHTGAPSGLPHPDLTQANAVPLIRFVGMLEVAVIEQLIDDLRRRASARRAKIESKSKKTEAGQNESERPPAIWRFGLGSASPSCRLPIAIEKSACQRELLRRMRIGISWARVTSTDSRLL